jgi:hypothetical protein
MVQKGTDLIPMPYQGLVHRFETGLVEKGIEGFIKTIIPAGDTGVHLFLTDRFLHIPNILKGNKGHITGNNIEILTPAIHEPPVYPRQRAYPNR